MFRLLANVVFMLCHLALFGQRDSITLEYDFVKKPGIAAMESFSINLLINRYDAWFFRNGGEYWAKVSPSSWKQNLQKGLEWDWNSFGTNWFGHPAHGSLFYNSARSLGLSYWESAPFSILGSYSWEFFGETHPASGNDFLTTSLGGIYLGEMTHRLSEKLLTYEGTGIGKVWRAGLATLLNPMRVFNRWINGVPRDAVTTTREEGKNTHLSGYLAVGANVQLSSLHLDTKGSGPFVELGMIYGSPYKNKKFYKPFETFEMRGWLRFVKDDIRPYPFINITSHAVLWGKNTQWSDSQSLFVGAFQHFDYLHDEVIEIGSLGFSMGLHHYYKVKESGSMFINVNLGPTVLGGSNNEIVGQFTNDPESLRDYILGPGFLVHSEIRFENPRWGSIKGDYKHFTFYVVSGPEGAEILDLLSFRYSHAIFSSYRLGFDYLRYYRKVKYDAYEQYQNFRKDLYEFRLFISYSF